MASSTAAFSHCPTVGVGFAHLANTINTQREIPFTYFRGQKDRATRVRRQIRPAEIVLRLVPDVRIPVPEYWFLLLDRAISGLIVAVRCYILLGSGCTSALRSFNNSAAGSISEARRATESDYCKEYARPWKSNSLNIFSLS